MNFFKHFNNVNYMGKDAINIMNSILMKYKNINSTTLYFHYTITDGESPESVSHKIYGEMDLHWTILLLNHLVDPYFEWALNAPQLTAFIASKYSNVYDIHHFTFRDRKLYPNQSFKVGEDLYISFNTIYDNWKNGIAIPQEVYIVTNTDYETTENDKRREIKILNKDAVGKFVDQFIELLSGKIGNATL